MADVPKDFFDALTTAGLDDVFLACTNAHRQEYLKWIAEAKRPATRKERIRKAVEMLFDKCTEATPPAKKKARPTRHRIGRSTA